MTRILIQIMVTFAPTLGLQVCGDVTVVASEYRYEEGRPFSSPDFIAWIEQDTNAALSVGEDRVPEPRVCIKPFCLGPLKGDCTPWTATLVIVDYNGDTLRRSFVVVKP